MKDKFFPCTGSYGGLLISYSRHWGLEIVPLSRNPSQSFINRIKLAWNALKGTTCGDYIILSDKEVANLAEYLHEVQNKNHYEDDHAELIETIVGHLFFAGHQTDAVEGILAWVKTSDCGCVGLEKLKKGLEEYAK